MKVPTYKAIHDEKMADTSSDEALARALQDQDEEEDLSPAPLEQQRSTPVAKQEKSWGEWWSDTSSQAAKLAQVAADASISAAQMARNQASALAAQAEELRARYDMEISSSVFSSMVTSPTSLSPNKKGSKGTSVSVNKDLDLVYVTENVIAMAFPFDPQPKAGKTTVQAGNDIHEVASYLKKHHESKFMIWNISEETYDYSIFNDQVLDYKFPGHPAPPLGLLFKICTSVESWLDADADNVAVIHCLTGKGRTAALTACVLSWLGEFTHPTDALSYIAERRTMKVDVLTIPSQRRYVHYFSNTLSGVKPRPEPLLLRRIIINTIPVFGTVNGEMGCCPYVQLFKGGKLICTSSPPTMSQGGDKGKDKQTPQMALRWIDSSEGCVSFNMDCAVQGDILLRCRHADSSGARVSMFRAAFHTGYVPSGVMRLTKAQLDGADTSNRFDEEFFIDLMFAPIDFADTSATTTATVTATTVRNSAGSDKNEVEIQPIKSNAIAVVGPPTDSGLVIDASSSDRYEQALHRDNRFWDSVAEKQQKTKKRVSRKFKLASQDKFSIVDDVDGDMNSGERAEEGKCNSSTAQHSSKHMQDSLARAREKEREVSNLDLIQQLALAEEGAEESEGGGGAWIDQQQRALALEDEDDISQTLSRGQVGLRSSTAAVELTAELQALEDLEKELGLNDLQMFGAGIPYAGTTSTVSSASSSRTPLSATGTGIDNHSNQSPTNGNLHLTDADISMLSSPGDGEAATERGGKGASDDDEDGLDELESYLESLSTTKGSSSI